MTSSLRSSSDRGQWAEELASSFLIKHGLSLVERNYRCRWGEIDLVMRHDDTLVFVEVRFRKDNRFGGAAASIDVFKQKRLINTAEHYLQTQRKTTTIGCRFDVVSIASGTHGPETTWIRDAFQAN